LDLRAGERVPSGADLGVQALRQGFDPRVGLDGLQRRDDLLVFAAGSRVDEVVAQ
jgi:hypothetical protein